MKSSQCYEKQETYQKENLNNFHWVKSVQIRIFFWYVFSRVQTEYGNLEFAAA